MMYQDEGSGKAAMFSHIGIVTSVAGRQVEVEIHRPEGCGNCSLNGTCGQGKRKVLNAVCELPCKPGDRVTVEISNQQGWRALFWGILLPFLCTISAVAISLYAGQTETLSALMGLASAALYYAVFYLFRNSAAQSYTIIARPL
ncbi:SoxR reducing system RseC family protein [Spirochaeta dissipatitropha]